MNPLAIFFLVLPLTAEANLFKCTDNAGKVTYTNSPCAKVGLKENKLIPPPPPPAIDTPAKAERTEKQLVEKSSPVLQPKHTAALQLMKTAQRNNDTCARLNAAMGRTMDEMDAARTQGGVQRKQAEWNELLRNLQAEKTRLGCF